MHLRYLKHVGLYKLRRCPVFEAKKSKVCQIFHNQLIVETTTNQIFDKRSQESQKGAFVLC